MPFVLGRSCKFVESDLYRLLIHVQWFNYSKFSKNQAVQFYQPISRAEEEIIRIKDEVLNCVHHYIGIYVWMLIRQTELYKQSEDEIQLCKLGKTCLLKNVSIKCFNQLNSLQCFMEYAETNE